MSEVGFSEAELKALLDNIDQLDDAEIAEVEAMVTELNERATKKAAHDDLIAFCLYIDPDYKVGRHHRVLADQLMALESGAKDRACVNMPPRHGKSQLASTYYPAWFLGRNPTKQVMMVSHTSDLAVDFGRKVRNLIADTKFQEIFPDITLAADSKSAGRWSTNHGGVYHACGVGSSLAGRGADMLIIDDPHSEQDVLNGNFGVFDKAYQWFTYGARTRLMPGGRVAVVQCMTGDTPVLRPDGTETALRDIRPGDMVASYDNGALVNRRVLNWASQGHDATFTIKLCNGKSVRANARHPFLVQHQGGDTWTRLQNLKVGDTLVSMDVGGLGKQSTNRAPATAAPKRPPESEKGWLSAKTAATPAWFAAHPDVRLLQYARVCADHTTTQYTGSHTRHVWTRTKSESTTCNANTASVWPIMVQCWNSRVTDAASAVITKTTSLFQNGLEKVHLLWLTTVM